MKPKPKKVDLSQWYTMPEASELLSKSRASIDRLVQQGQIERRHRPAPGRTRPESVYNPADIERLSTPVAVVRDAPEPPVSTQLAHSPVPTAQIEPIQLLEVMERMFAALAPPPPALPPPPPPPEKPYITVEEAADITGLSKSLIRRLCLAGKLGFRDGIQFKIRRTDLADVTKLVKALKKGSQ